MGARSRGLFVSMMVLLPVVAVIAAEPTAQQQKQGPCAVAPDSVVVVTADTPDRSFVEPSLAVDPDDPDNLVIASIGFIREQVPTVAVHTSRDRGRSWSRTPLETPPGRAVDPWLAFGRDGRLYLAVLTPVRVTDQVEPMGILVYRSEDGGATWAPASQVPFGRGSSFDHPTLAVAPASESPWPRPVYAFASQSFGGGVFPVSLARSADGARSFDDPVSILPNDFNNQNGNLVVMADGTVVATFFEIGKGGKKLDHPRLWSVRSTDTGRSFENPVLVSESFNLSWPVLAIDRSAGPRSARLYAVWAGLEDDPTVHLAASDDAGLTWSRPRRVDPRPSGAEQKRPNVAVDAEGRVVVAWFERRSPPADGGQAGDCPELNLAVSGDGGETFSAPMVIFDGRPCPEARPDEAWDHGERIDVGESFPFGGDYFGLAGAPDGFHVAWTDRRSGVFQVRAATVTCD